MSNRFIKIFALFTITLLTMFTLCSCDSINNNEIVGSEGNEDFKENEEESKDEDLREVVLSEDDFTLSIGTLPYRGAVLFINYEGDVDLSEYVLQVDIYHENDITQEKMPVEEVDENLVSTIVDLMYLPGDELYFVINAKNAIGEEIIFKYSLVYDGYYPWKDWMLSLDEPVSIDNPSWLPTKKNFDYNPDTRRPAIYHSSWDLWTTKGQAVEVYSGTLGIVFRIPPACIEGNLEIYNPYVGAIVQYGHTEAVDHLYMGRLVEPGELIAHIIPEDYHIHYSVIRPYRYVKGVSDIGFPLNIPDKLNAYYFPIISERGRFIYHDSYDDPFYWHEPTTLGYWYEETLPKGLKEEMIKMFNRDNPDVILPARKPLRE